MTDKAPTTDAALGIIEAIARLQAAFLDAGLREPVAVVLAGEEQAQILSAAFARYLGDMRPHTERPWEGTTIRGMKVICNVPA